ncbi:hypothetical protein G3I13_21545 [Streptomyces sp. SID6673]|nr:hypothetical protein [Streptomyces sp. SID11726]NEB26926.1 hypothetical protein [Streptomyces sp. SID6673]
MSDEKPVDPSPKPASGAEAEDTTQKEYFAGERGRTVPRAAWLVLAVALVILLVFVFVQPKWFTHDADDTSLDVPADRHFTKTLEGAGHADGVWLTDDSPSTSYLVTFPADSARDETRLHLSGTSQVAADSVVFMTVKMDGQQVYKSELPHGEHDVDTFVDVPDQIADDGHVRVQVMLTGSLSNQTCVADHSTGMQVHLDPGTVVEAALTERVHTVRDAVVSWNRDVTVVIADQTDEWRTAAAQLGIALTRAGHRVTFAGNVPDSDVQNSIVVGPVQKLGDLGWSATDSSNDSIVMGTANNTPVVGIVTPRGDLISSFLTSTSVTTADSDQNDPQTLPVVAATGNEVGLERLGADTSVTQIGDNHKWRAAYSLADLPDGRLPQAVRVALQLPASPDDLTWILNTELNGQLIDSRRLPKTPTTQATIPMPATAQLMDNTVTFTVQRDRNIGGCDVRVTNYPIQLESSSALVLGNDPGAGFTSLPRILTPGSAVYWPDAAKSNAVDELNAVIPALTKFIPDGAQPSFEWNAQPAPGKPFILVGQSPEVNTLVRLQDGRLVAGPGSSALDISSFDNGMVLQTATSTSRAGGLAITYVGAPGRMRLPAFGREPAEVVTSQASFAVGPDGKVVDGPSDSDSPG